MSIKKTLNRAAMITIAAMAMILVASSPAAAANRTVVLVADRTSDYGSMTHIDSGDKFKVCDLRKDDYAVVGKVYEWVSRPGDGYWDYQFTEKDGGDSGCDTHQNNITGYAKIKLCWAGPGLHCTSEEFYE